MNAVAEIQVDEGVEIPPARLRTAPPLRYPFSHMKVGESFFIPMERAHSVATAASQFKRHHPGGRDFTTRFVIDGERGPGIRCWRVQ